MITVIMPVYNEGPYIFENVSRMHELLNEAAVAHDFLLVDDGSKNSAA